MAYNVRFLKGTAAAYADIASKDVNTFYYTSDDNQLYLGTIKLSNASEIAAAVSRIGANENSISALQNAVNLLNEDDDTKAGTIKKMIKDAIDALDNQLAAVAKSGAAADVSIADASDKFTATTVEAALTELATNIENAESDSAVTVVADSTTPTEGYLKSYRIYQGGNAASDLIGTIDIPKDLVVTAGSVVENPVGQPAGTYIQLSIANQDEPIYINVANLVDIYTPEADADQIQLAISNNEVSASIVDGSVDSDALGTDSVVTGKIADGNVTKVKLAQSVQDSLDAADTAVQSVVEGDTNGTIKVDGSTVAVHGLDTAAYQPASAFDAAGAADAVLGESTDGASANTVYGAKAAAASAQSAADAANQAIANLDVTDTAVAGQYVSAVSQTDGEISVTRANLPDYSTTYDAYGAADTAESNAKAYTDEALTWQSF